MTALAPVFLRLIAAAVALASALSALSLERRGRTHGAFTALALAALAALAGGVPGAPAAWAVPGVALAVALLARDRDDRLQTECALKLAWVVAPALALSWAGVQLLTLAAGTAIPSEQWGVLALAIDPPTLWRTALPLSLLAGAVLVGAAPFHAWLADLMHGGRAWAAPLTAAALQALGMAWLAARVAGVEADPDAAALATGLLGFGATVAFLASAATLVAQRRPERRVGTLASLQGGLVLASFAAAQVGAPLTMPHADAWAAHLMLSLAGAGLVARFLPVAEGPAPAAALFRRHPLAGLAGLFALLSLAGVPGTPGARLWFETARSLAHAGRVVPLFALGAAWTTAFVVAVREARAAFGVPAPAASQPGAVPWPARAAMWIAAVGLVLVGLAWGWRG